MRRDELYLADIVEAADSISAFASNVEETEFVGNDMLRSAVLQKLAVIGEAASRISAELRSRYPTTPWAQIVAFRNIAVHAYFSVQWSIVWTTATQDVPSLKIQIAEALRAEESRENP